MGNQTNEVVITGLGPVTSIGVGNDALWAALGAGASNVAPRPLPVDVGRVIELSVASMPPVEEVPGLKPHLDFLSGQELAGYRDLAYALRAIELAITDAQLYYDRDNNRIGVIQAFEAPGFERVVGRLLGMFTTPLPVDGPPPVYDLLAPAFYSSQPFIYVQMVGKAFGFHGFSTSVHNACASGAFAMELAAQRIRSGEADVMIVAGGEAFDTATRLEWFHRLDMYARDERMRPFDPESTGFYVGEGAGAIVLESAAHAASRGRTPYATYLGGAFAHQAWKQILPDVRAMRLRDVIAESLTRAGVEASELDLVVPHGAGTPMSDGYEAACLEAALGGQANRAVATAFKPNIGHMLAASCIVETVCMLLAMHHQTIPGTLHTRPQQAKIPLPLVATCVEGRVDTAMKLATGFTGHDAACVFRKA